jgi:16S rRNA G966 N2-methylase RsmD
MVTISLYLCEHLLQQYHLPANTIPSLINYPKAKEASVLELGAGTGLCAVLLNELFRSWTATDQYDNLKLIQRNLRENKLEDKVRVKEVDWFQGLQKTNQREEQDGYDLVLAIDCIYNEALIKPLVAIFDRYATRGRTLLWVVIELRSSDVVSSCLDQQLSISTDQDRQYRRSPPSWKNGSITKIGTYIDSAMMIWGQSCRRVSSDG